MIPSAFSFRTGNVVSVNGSSVTGMCSDIGFGADTTASRCATPTSSVLFDGNIPTLTGLDGDMWASQLLTLQTTFPSATEIVFDFPAPSRVDWVELMLFSCTSWGISVQTIRLLGPSGSLLANDNVVNSSCDSLLRVCLSRTINAQKFTLAFIPPPVSNWVHLAEVTFHPTGPVCASDVAAPPPGAKTLPPQDGTSESSSTVTIETCELIRERGKKYISAVCTLVPKVVS